MKKKEYWIIGIVVVIVLIGIIFYFRDLNKEKYDITKEEQLVFISSWIENLEECQGYSKFSPRDQAIDAGYDYSCFDSTDIDDNNLSKLKALENLKGILVYNGSSSNYNDDGKCNLLWKFDYQHVVVRTVYSRISVYECKDKFYIILGSFPGAPTIDVYRTKLNEEIINKLKE